MKISFLTTLALGAAAIANAQPGQNQTSIDAHALNAVQINLHVQFGPGTTPGSFQCPQQKSSNQAYCIAQLGFYVPTGKRFVVENINVSVLYDSNSSGLALTPAINFLVTVGDNTSGSVFPFDSNVTLNGGTQYFMMNKNVRYYIDPAAGFPEIFLSNGTNVINGHVAAAGDLGAATGYLNLTLQGYYVDLN